VRPRPSRRRCAVLIWLALLGALAGAFVLRQRDEIARMGQILRETAPHWLLAAVGVELLTVALLGLQYRAVLARLGHRPGWPALVRGHLQRQVVGAVVPLGGPASVYVFVRFLNQRGVPTARGLFATALYSLAGYASFIVVLIPALAWFEIERGASGFMLAGTALLMGLFGLALAALIATLRGRELPGWAAGRAPARARAFAEEIRGHALGAADLLRPLGIAVAVKGANIALLWACLHAAGQRAALPAVLAGYVMASLCTAIAPFFQGLGMVELSMVAVLSEFGVPIGAALAATLLFRLFEQWLPLALGVVVEAVERRRALRDAPGQLWRWLGARAGSLAGRRSAAPVRVRALNPADSSGD
ncbi:MAG: flippase-like domain-containing protein, partial [Chloroflexota bacterium]|nr:flippase-like domain-containing protein [Chloroflexota bacterium]